MGIEEICCRVYGTGNVSWCVSLSVACASRYGSFGANYSFR